MEKLVYLTRLRDASDPVAHAEAVLDAARREILPQARALTVQVADLAADPRIRPEHFLGDGRAIGASVSLWSSSSSASPSPSASATSTSTGAGTTSTRPLSFELHPTRWC